MPNKTDMTWFKQQFHVKIENAVQGTPFSLDLLTALASQETGEIWQILRKKDLTVDRILELCVGDTRDGSSSPPRSAFPTTKAMLLEQPNGQQMFDIARQALVDMAGYVPGYNSMVNKANKFCHGFGIFQYDLQFFIDEPAYFLQKKYANFDACLQKALEELRHAMNGIGWKNKTSLTDYEMACVAIAYNIGAGRFKASKGLKQGYKPPNGKHYGELMFEFIRLAHTAPTDGAPAVIATPVPGNAALPPPTPVEATGKRFVVDVKENPLRLRSEPKIDQQKPKANVIAHLPDGHIVQLVSTEKINGFREVETSLLGAHFRGFAFADFLKPAPTIDAVPVLVPAETPPTTGITAVLAPRKSGSVTKRTEPANALSLNEPGQPGRKGTTPDELRSELGEIISWLAVDKLTHRRYRPIPNATFCNIYAHDYCHLAGVYLPRVWWTQSAIEKLAQGQTVEPKLGNSIDEQRANDLFRWLRDFGLRFGWRQTGTLTKLQTEVNQGAVGVIVARRKIDGMSGHIAAVVPETEAQTARRDASGEVIAPLQSQAGRNNFQYGRSGMNWWKGEKFAESAFWVHS